MTHVARSPADPLLDIRDIQHIVTAPGRQIQLQGLFNMRDLGGYPTEAGGAVRWGALFRSDGLHLLDRNDVAILAGLGLRTVVDLRTHVEVEAAPSALGGLPARTTHISLLVGDIQALPVELEAIYRYMIDECGASIGAAVKLLCAADTLPALVHCSAGKDRTGIVVALVLSVLGVPDEVIAADYALSAINLDPDTTPAIGQLQATSGLGDKLTASLLASPPALILDVLARARATTGSVAGYLLDHGLTQAELTALRNALVE